MDSANLQTLNTALAWFGEGRRVALVTLARTVGSAPRPAGAWLALRDDGQIAGSVSGGCVEEDLVARLRAGEFLSRSPVCLSYGVDGGELARWGLPCGGTLELVLEPAPDPSQLAALKAYIDGGRMTRRVLDVASGRVVLEEAALCDRLIWNGVSLTTVHGPLLRLLVIGAGQIASYLAPMARALDYRVTVCDPREEYRGPWNLPEIPLTAAMPDDAVQTLRPDRRTAIVALTHDPKLDDLALLEAIKSPAFYVGALGSRSNAAKRRERMRRYFAVCDADLERLHGPVGLPIGSRTPAEIAVSILAHMTAAKNGVESLDRLTNRGGATHPACVLP